MEWIGWALAVVLAAVSVVTLMRKQRVPDDTEERARADEQLAAARAELAADRGELDQDRAELTARGATIDAELERVAGLTPEQARAEIITRIEHDAKLEAVQSARAIEQRAKQGAEREARGIIVGAIQRLAAEQTAESVVTVVQLPNEEMKGRIIGREGRNIRSFESISGANVLIDDTPQTVLISCFDPVRRETARMALEALVEDGRIHPQRIEEVYEKAQRDIDEKIREAAEDALAEVGIVDLHPELIHTLGSLAYRTSYGQNVLAHLIESAHMAGLMAAELGLDVAFCKRAAFLHDIGKALTHENEGPHAIVGAELLRRHGEHEDIVHAVEAHHNEVEPRTVEAVLLQAADAISGARPGARRESLDTYVERMESLERIAMRHDGISRAFAMQAGHEVRVMVEPEKVDDAAAQVLAYDIAKEIEDTLSFPGQIRITVVRESRATATAR
ncbi:MAG: ribonuclease Y [Propionibacterium sp.]|nr:ribonuclease Y [Propionibacterium sp.]